MTTSPSLRGLPLTIPVSDVLKRKRLLLVDISSAKRELRAEAMRKLGVDVDCACDIGEARAWWRADLYNLVLVNMGSELGDRDRFCDDIRGATPPQHVAFYVGQPEYLATDPQSEEIAAAAAKIDCEAALLAESEAARAGERLSDTPLRWGIMAASRKISAVRSVSVARSNAIRNRPTPPRDMETRDSRRAEIDDRLRRFQKERIV